MTVVSRFIWITAVLTVLIKQTVLPLFVVLLEVLEYANKDNNPQVAIKKQKLESCLLS